MILKQFPDIHWLKQRIGQVGPSRQLPKETLPPTSWPTVILNVTTCHTERPDIRGPLSIFTNLSGESYATVNRHRVRVNEQSYFLSNRDEHYSLEIGSQRPVETFNIHIGNEFSDQFYQSWSLSENHLLDQPFPSTRLAPAFFNQLYTRDAAFDQLIRDTQLIFQENSNGSLAAEEQLARLMQYLLARHQHLLKEIAKLPPVREATKVEIYRRVALTVDYLHSYYDRNPGLDELAQLACLSKFHYLRLFKVAFQLTPHQYLTRIRLKNACQLLKKTSLPVQDIALGLGFENASSFSRVFHQHLRIYPTSYRNVR